MGGTKNYLQSGGFSIQEYEATGEMIDGIKVIKHKTEGNASLPQMSNTPGTIYIMQNDAGYKQIGIYGEDRRLQKTIEFRHSHKGIKGGIAHVHNHRGGRGNNVRKMSKKEIKKYGKTVLKIGGKISGKK